MLFDYFFKGIMMDDETETKEVKKVCKVQEEKDKDDGFDIVNPEVQK